MSCPAVLLIARFDDARHAHASQRLRALERLGCRVTRWDPADRPGPLGRLLRGDARARLLAEFRVAPPDVVLVIGGAEPDETLLREARAANPSTRWVNWFPDDRRTAHDAARRARRFDRVFAIGSDVRGLLLDGGGRPAELLPLAADPSIYRPVRSRDIYRANVVFAGTATPRREALLTGLVEFGLALWGPGWRETSLRPYCRGETLRTDAYVKAYNGATVAVNIHHRDEQERAEASCNQRVFELAAMGVAQVVDAREDLPSYFEPDRDLVLYRKAAELRDRVRALLEDPAVPEALGANARRAALASHTYMHRMRRFLDLLGAGD